MEIRVLDPDELDAVFDLRARAFGPNDNPRRRRIGLADIAAGRLLGVYDGTRLVASATHFVFEQWWLGRAVPMGGVASVCVAPQERGRGVGRLLATAFLDSMRGLPISVLFPATSPLYRGAGYEHAGAQHMVTLRPEDLRTLAAGHVAVRPAGVEDAAEVTALLRRLHAEARDCGPIDRGEDFFRDLLANDDIYTYLAEDGFLAYGWAGGDEAMNVHRCVAGSPETARALWSIVGSGSSVAQSVSAYVSPADPMLWLLRDRSKEWMHRESWMLRVLDAPAAVAARGFPAGVSAEIPLVIDDERLPANSGGWRLTVAGGQGRLERAPEEPGAVRLPARGVSALYAGVPLPTLRGAGIIEGGGASDPLLESVFAATPYMLDNF